MPKSYTTRLLASLVASCLGVAALTSTYAGDVAVKGPDGKDVKDAKATPPEPRFKIYGWLEGGITANPQSPTDHSNFGHLFTDRPNEPLLNQFVITAERTLDPKLAGEFDWGFKAQMMYGTDSRYIHSLGIFDNTQHEIYQPDLVEAWLLLHTPVPGTSGGLDVKLGKFVTLEGVETIDPRTNVFYSHSYIFNYGIPLNHTGGLFTLHVTPWLDIINGVTRGVNTSINDNNDQVAYHGGIGLNFGKLTILATTHVGAETVNNNHDYRYLSDIAATWKVTDKFTAMTDLNYAQDDFGPTNSRAYGFAQYFTYALNDAVTLGIREEVFRDEQGFFVAQFADNDDFVDIERGKLNNIDVRTVGAGGPTTYNELTFGATINVPVPKPLATFKIRPEVRWDAAVTRATTPFDSSTKRDQVTFGVDAIITF